MSQGQIRGGYLSWQEFNASLQGPSKDDPRNQVLRIQESPKKGITLPTPELKNPPKA